MEVLVDWILNFSGITAYLIVFAILLACGFGLPIPEDITLFAAGILAYEEIFNIYIIIPVCFAGVLIGDCTIYYLGRRYGRHLTQKWFFKKIFTESRLNKVEAMLNGKGNKLLFAVCFMPGLRTPIFFMAGVSKVPFKYLMIFDGSAALISVPTIVWLVYHFGDEVEQVIKAIKKVEHGILYTIILIILLVIIKIHFKNRKKT